MNKTNAPVTSQNINAYTRVRQDIDFNVAEQKRYQQRATKLEDQIRLTHDEAQIARLKIKHDLAHRRYCYFTHRLNELQKEFNEVKKRQELKHTKK